MTPSFSTVNPSTPTLQPGDALFGRFIISVNCIFYRSALNSLAFVNLRPIVPGHVLVIPQRVVAELNDLEAAEYTDLWTTVRRVQLILRNLHADKQLAFNVAVQDGVAAGQTVPHVHVHILPRVAGDYKRNDDIYRDLEAWAPRDDLEHVASQLSLIVPEDDQRRDRTANEMAEEAATYRKIAETLEHA